jgi:hypothetical protein
MARLATILSRSSGGYTPPIIRSGDSALTMG